MPTTDIEDHNDIQLADGVTAYHGSPHEFEEFDPAFIGTGEGAQAYGHGLYFAENENVAKEYRDALAPGVTLAADGRRLIDMPEHERQVHNYLYRTGKTPKDAVSHFEKEAAAENEMMKMLGFEDTGPSAYSKHIDFAKGLKERPSFANKGLGHMYEVRLNVGPEHLLDWDKPLNEQHPEVRKKVLESKGFLKRTEDEDRDLMSGQEIYKMGHDQLKDSDIRGIRYADQGSRPHGTDSKIKKDLQSAKNRLEYLEQYSDPDNEYLKELSKKHIAHLENILNDYASKTTHNYVIFDPQHIKVKRRYAEGGEVPEDKDEGIVAYAFGNSIPHIEERIAKGEFPEIEGESSSGITKRNPEPAEYIEPGSIKHTHTHDETGSYISAVTRPKGKRSASIVDLYVPEEHRGKGIGKILQKSMIEQFPNLQGQVSSKIAAKSAYELGRRLAENEKASLEDIYKKIDEDSSANLWTPTKSYGGGVPSYIPEERVEDLARRLITFSYAVAPLVPRVKGTYAEGGSVDDPIASAVDTARNLNPMGFYSAAAEAASKFPQKAPIDQIVNKIKGQPNVKKEELDNANLADAFAGQRSVDPQEVARHLQASIPQIKEKVYGGSPSVKYEPKALLERPKGFENTDDVYEVGPQGKPPHLIAVNGNNFDVWGPSGYHNSFDSFNDAVEYANQSIHNIEPPLYGEYTIPGGKNYREVVMALPQHKGAMKTQFRVTGALPDSFNSREEAESYIQQMQQMGEKNPGVAKKLAQFPMDIVEENKPVSEPYKSSHWLGIPNPLAHLRMSDRDNGKTLHLEELQSDWGQEGREEGFGEGKVPVGPYVTDTDKWVDLGLKRALMEAAKGGYDKLIWTPGEAHTDRYKLSKRVKQIVYDPEDKTLSYMERGRPGYESMEDIPGNVEPHEIKKHIGKEAAKRLLATEPHKLSGNHILEGLDLEVGGEGMEDFYDKLVPQRLSKLISQHDQSAKIEKHSYPLSYEVGTGRTEDIDWHGNPVEEMKTKNVQGHVLHITPKLREAILKGLPAFEKGGFVANKAIGGGSFQGKKPPSIKNLARVKDKFIYHSGTVHDLQSMKDYLDPQHGDWIREIAEHSGYDDPDELLEKSTPLIWMSDKPTWVVSKVARKLNKPHNKVTVDDIREHGHVAVIPRKGDHADHVWRVGEEGLQNGPYSEVTNLNGEKTKAYNTDLFDDNKEPFGVERNEYISAQSVEPLVHLTGNDLVDFLRETGDLPRNNLNKDQAFDRGGSIIRRALDVISKLPQ